MKLHEKGHHPEYSFSLIVFDWDGTLIDSTEAIVHSIQASAADLKLPIPSRKDAAYVIGLGLKEAVETALPGLDRDLYPLLLERYKFHYQNTIEREEPGLFPGVEAMLTDLSRRGFRLAVATGKSRSGLNHAMERSGLKSFFQASRCADETASKPNPDMLLEITRELNEDINRTVMIGDTTHDLEMARRAGTSAAAVLYGAHPPEVLMDMKPAYAAGSIQELHQWLIKAD